MYYFLLRAKSWICINKLHTVSLCCSERRLCFPLFPLHYSCLSHPELWAHSHQYAPRRKQPQQSRPCKSKNSLMSRQRGDSHSVLTFREKNQVAPTKIKRKKNIISLLPKSLFLKVPVFPDLTFEQFTFVWNHPIIPLEPSEGQIPLHPVVLTTNIPLNNKISKSQTQARLLETFSL